MSHSKNRKIWIAVLVVLLIVIGWTYWYKMHHDVAQPSWIAATPQTDFLYGSTGGERTAGIPYWIWLALPRMFPEYLHYPGGYAAVGMSWEEGVEMPAGFSKKIAGYVRVAGNCAICHAASYRAGEDPVPHVVAAIPGHTVDPQKLLTFLKQCADDPRFNASELFSEINMATKLSLLDKALYRLVLIPRARRMLSNQEAILDAPLRRHSQNPHADTPFTDAHMKSLADWVRQLPAPKYPLDVNDSLIPAGKQVFAQHCAPCHSLDRTVKPKVVPLAEAGTDRAQLDAWTQAAGQANASETLGSARVEMAKARGYAAGSLDGIWLRGPYLHNGSVPTVRQLLDPSQRPAKFYVGNDLIATDDLGFEWKDPKQPGRRDFVHYDTTKPGNSNAGHLYGTNLSNADKNALLEYMKTL